MHANKNLSTDRLLLLVALPLVIDVAVGRTISLEFLKRPIKQCRDIFRKRAVTKRFQEKGKNPRL